MISLNTSIMLRIFARCCDAYKILGVPKSSSQEEIKTAYKKLALKWHPDRNQSNRVEAEKKFKEISEAYQTLSDPGKRRSYDSAGTAPPQTGFNYAYNYGQPRTMNMRDFEEIMKQHFGMRSPFGAFGAQQVEISEKVIVKGGRRFLQVTRKTQRPDGSSNTEISETALDP